MSEKTLEETVQPEDETKDTGTQSDDASTEEDDEESTEDFPESTEGDENDDEGGEGEKKRFKDRKERAEFFKKKQQEEKGGDDDVVRKSDLYKQNEKTAIRNLTEAVDDDDHDTRAYKEYVNDNWQDIVPLVNLRSIDKTDVASYEKAIRRAVLIHKSENPDAGDSTDIEARKRIMADGGVRGSSGKGTAPQKKTILGNTAKGMSDWYPA